MSNVERAATWLATTPDSHRPHPSIPQLQVDFGLTLQEAIKAVREANQKCARVP